MNWIKEAEHMRDYGHTWGPGIDDRTEPTPEEIQENRIWWEKFNKTKAQIRIEPTENVKIAIEKMQASLPDSDAISSGLAPYNWRETYSEAKLELAKKAAQNLGYELVLENQFDADKNRFLISIEYYGYLPEREGNLHHYNVQNIPNKEDCLQLFADFAEIGYWPTVWYQDCHIHLHDPADLRLEMVRWGFPLETEKNNVDEKIQSAKARTVARHTGTEKEREEPAL